MTADNELVEVYSAMCGRCKDALSANDSTVSVVGNSF